MIPQWLTTWVEGKIRAAAARVRVITKSGRPAELAGYAGAAGEESYQDPALLMQQYGFRSRPGPGSEAATLKVMGEKTQALIVATEAPGVGPNDQADWEVEIYSKSGQRLRLMADGSMHLSVPGGGVVYLPPDGRVLLADSSGGTATLEGGRLTVSTELAARHCFGTGAQPTATPISANVSTAVVSAGTDDCCVLLLTVAPNPSVGPLCIVTFAAPWPSPPIVSVSQSGSAEKITWSSTPTGITLSCASLPVGSYELILTSRGVA